MTSHYMRARWREDCYVVSMRLTDSARGLYIKCVCDSYNSIGAMTLSVRRLVSPAGTACMPLS
jgi:hypothetical protein